MSTTTDPTDPRLERGVDEGKTPQYDGAFIKVSYLCSKNREPGGLRSRSPECDSGTLTNLATGSYFKIIKKSLKFSDRGTFLFVLFQVLYVSEFVWAGTKERVGS